MKKNWNARIVIALAILLFVPFLQARPVENRYLFILETSSVMKKQSVEAHRALLDLIGTGFHGRMRVGDTFGIWTYNDDLHAGDFPMQTWDKEERDTLAAKARDYLTAQKYKGGAHLEKALRAMLSVVTNSPNLTVILISDGKQAVAGTPFDEEIFSLHHTYYDEFHAAKVPFVTILAASRGQFFDFSVNSARGPIRIPVLPTPPPAVTNSVVVATTNAPEVAMQKPAKKAESLILIWPKTNSVTADKRSTTTVAPIITTNPESVLAAAAATAPTETAKATEPVSTPTPVTTAPPVVNTPPAPISTPEPIAVAPTPPPAVIPPASVTPPATIVPQPVKKEEPAVVVTPENNSKIPAPAASVPPPVENKAVEKTLVAEPEKSATVETKEAQPAPVASGVSASAPPPTAGTEPAFTPPSATPEVATVAPSFLSTRNILVIAVALLAAAVVILLLMLRRAQTTTHPSLITQSLRRSDRVEEPKDK